MPANSGQIHVPATPPAYGCGDALPDDCRITLRTTPDRVRAALADLRQRLSPLGLEPEELGSVELVTAEALNNIVEHAHGGAPDGRIGVMWTFGATGLVMRIEDDGTPMPDGRAPLMDHAVAPAPPADPHDAPEGGFGWFLITALARNIQYRRERDLNVLTFRMAVGLVARGQG